MKRVLIILLILVIAGSALSGCFVKKASAPVGKEVLLAKEGEGPKSVSSKRIFYVIAGLLPLLSFEDAFTNFKLFTYDVNNSSTMIDRLGAKKVRVVFKYDLLDYFIGYLLNLILPVGVTINSIDVEVIE
ncbi:MAG: hypothetical protein ABDH28_04395 [Brevinematia bacterium]